MTTKEDAQEGVFVSEDFQSGTKVTINENEDTISFSELQKALEENPGENKEGEEEFQTVKECIDFEEMVFGLVTESDRGIMTCKKIAEYLLFSDPRVARARFAYMQYVELTGARLEEFFYSGSIGQSYEKLISHIDEKIAQVSKYQAIKAKCEKIMECAKEKRHALCIEAVRELRPGEEVEHRRAQLASMLTTTATNNSVWLSLARDHMLALREKDGVVQEMMVYAEQFYKSQKELEEKGVISSQNRPDPFKAWILPIMFSLFLMPAKGIKDLYKVHKRAVAEK